LTVERGTDANTGSASRKSTPEVNIENGTGIDYLDQLIEEEKRKEKNNEMKSRQKKLIASKTLPRFFHKLSSDSKACICDVCDILAKNSQDSKKYKK
jgi:hypothetical protein